MNQSNWMILGSRESWRSLLYNESRIIRNLRLLFAGDDFEKIFFADYRWNSIDFTDISLKYQRNINTNWLISIDFPIQIWPAKFEHFIFQNIFQNHLQQNIGKQILMVLKDALRFGYGRWMNPLGVHSTNGKSILKADLFKESMFFGEFSRFPVQRAIKIQNRARFCFERFANCLEILKIDGRKSTIYCVTPRSVSDSLGGRSSNVFNCNE